MRTTSNRARTLALVAALGLAGSATAAEKATEQTGWNIFWTAARDALAGAPSASALGERRHFEAAGISFDYPAPLHLMHDADSYPTWELTYGDFELELHVPDADALDAGAYLGMMSELFESRGKPELSDGEPVVWCGVEITPVRLQVTMFGERHRMHGYDLPGVEGHSRFLVFDDVPEGAKPSATAAATFEMVSQTLKCS